MLPPVADQVTAVLVVPVTVAVNCCVPLVSIAADVGEIETETGVLTVTWAEADAVLSATLVAFTV
jgi:hypothetical protein